MNDSFISYHRWIQTLGSSLPKKELDNTGVKIDTAVFQRNLVSPSANFRFSL